MEKEGANQNLQYLLVLDFEATCINEQKMEPCAEIIEFPIVVVHLPSGKKLDIFHHYVKPSFNPKLSKFCTELTGITQDQVDQGFSLPQVLEQLDKWFSSLKYLSEDNFAIVTCGDWDLRTCLRHQSKHKRLYIRKYLRNYINIKKYYAKIVDNQGSQGMMSMLKGLGLPHEGRHHSGIDDVQNICNVCVELYHKFNAHFPKTEIDSVAFHLPAENIPPQIRYILVLDFEATCLDKQKIQPCPQIIEMPVIAIDTHECKELDCFHRYVRPTLNPKISPFCTQLTGITQEQVQNQGSIQKVLQEFDEWVLSRPYLKENNFVFLTCGDWDICTCLRMQSKVKHLQPKKYFQRYINLKSYFPKLVKMKGKVTGMTDMLKHMGLKPEGKHHSGIDDVKNISRICLQLLQKHDAKFPRLEVRNMEI